MNPADHQSLRYLVCSHSGIMWTSNLGYGKLAKASPKGRLLQSRSSSFGEKESISLFQSPFTLLGTHFHWTRNKIYKSSQNKSIAMNKQYYSNIQLAAGLTNEQ